MSREEAIEIIKREFAMDEDVEKLYPEVVEAREMAISALENIGHLKDRPCEVCEFHKENGCCKWTCVFCDELFGNMRGAE